MKSRAGVIFGVGLMVVSMVLSARAANVRAAGEKADIAPIEDQLKEGINTAAAAGVTAYGEDGKGGRNLGEKIRMIPLSKWMKMSYSEFTGPGIGKNYGMAALVTYYFFHMDGGGDRNAINAFLRAIRSGKRGQEALDVLLDGRTWTELAADIKKGWRSRGIEINWAEES